MRSLLILASCLTLSLVTCGCPLPTGPEAIVVPSSQFPTIQSAVDQLPSGSVIEIQDGLHAESLVIANKKLTIIGSETASIPPQIQGASATAPVITLRGSAELTLSNLRLIGGSVSVSGEFNQIPTAPKPTLIASKFAFEHAERGVYGSFEKLDLGEGEITGHLYNGLSLFRVQLLKIDKIRIHGNSGVGLYVEHLGEYRGGSYSILGSVIENNARGGIDVWGAGARFTLGTSTVRNNGVYGVSLDLAHKAMIYASKIEDTRFGTDPVMPWGIGIRIFHSREVQIAGNTLTGNAYFAMGAYGCADAASDGPSDVLLKNNTVSSSSGSVYSLVHDVMPGCSSDSAGWWSDGGGNVCNGGGCGSQSAGGSLTPAPLHTP